MPELSHIDPGSAALLVVDYHVDAVTNQAIAAANGLTPFANMEANNSILERDAEKAIIQ